jgi:uncharacterized protein YgiM (DUF1202 family)
VKKVNFLLLFLICLNTVPTLQGAALFESAEDVEMSESIAQTESASTSTVKADESSINESNITSEEAKEEKAAKTSIISGKGYVKSTGWLNLRAKPSKSSKRLAKLHFNDVVNIIGHQDGWYQIDSPQNGWVMAEFISPTPNASNGESSGKATLANGIGYVNCDGWLNLRARPTKSSKAIARLYKNDSVNIIASSGDWYQIDSPQSGWVMAEFISAEKTVEVADSGSSSSGSDGDSPAVDSGSENQENNNTFTGTMSTEPMGGSKSSTYNPGTKGNGTTTIKTLNETWTVVKTPVGVIDFSKFLIKNKICQDYDTAKYGSACLSFAYHHASNLYNGNMNITVDKRSGGGYFRSLIDDNKQYILNALYLEIMAGRPCILHVNGNKQGTGRHFVTCIGFKSSVTSGETITEEDLLILDSWDAKIERMDQKNSRFMTSGKQCRKDYSGYRIEYMK